MFKRIFNLFRAFVNKLLGIAEKDSAKMLLEQSVSDMVTQAAKAKREVAEAIASEKKLFRILHKAKDSEGFWDSNARKALTAGNEELAVEALQRKKDFTEQVVELKPAWDKQIVHCNKLKSKLKEMQVKINTAKRNKIILSAKLEAAEAQEEIARVTSSMDDNSAYKAFERVSDQVDDITARSEAQVILSEDLEGDTLEGKFAELNGTSVDADLAALKSSMGLNEPLLLNAESTKLDTLPQLLVKVSNT